MTRFLIALAFVWVVSVVLTIVMVVGGVSPSSTEAYGYLALALIVTILVCMYGLKKDIEKNARLG